MQGRSAALLLPRDSRVSINAGTYRAGEMGASTVTEPIEKDAYAISHAFKDPGCHAANSDLVRINAPRNLTIVAARTQLG